MSQNFVFLGLVICDTAVAVGSHCRSSLGVPTVAAAQHLVRFELDELDQGVNL